MKIETKIILPEYASELLARNINNRSLSDTTVKRYVAEMKAGNWQLNGDTIRIDINNNLLDGQHRLTACVISQMPFETLVVSELPSNVFKTIDTGKIRKASDTLKIEGYKYTSSLAASSRFLACWFHGHRAPGFFNGGTYPISNTDTLNFVAAHSDLEVACQICKTDYAKMITFFGSSVGIGCFYIFHKKDPALAHEYYSKLSSGIGLEENDLILNLREKCAEYSLLTNKLKPSQKAFLLINTWNRLRSKETKGKILLREIDKIPEIK